MNNFIDKNINLYEGNSLDYYSIWDSPKVIVSDGPYGIGGFEGDPKTYEELPAIYEEHVKKWTEKSTPHTTLWFWNTEVGWAVVHPILEKYGWEYKGCNIWNKGKSHIAGNVNTKTLSKFPVVTEVCAHYVKKAFFTVGSEKLNMQEWLRYEWKRTGMPFSKTNEACGVASAASRKYFTSDNLWYMPPAEAFEKLVTYANLYGRESGRPYFSVDGVQSLTKEQWEKLKSKFDCPYNFTNVWDLPPVRGGERLKRGTKVLHLNQKPLSLIEMLIEASSDKGDVIWEPFGGLATAAVASFTLERKCFVAEIDPLVFTHAKNRLNNHIEQELSKTLTLDLV